MALIIGFRNDVDLFEFINFFEQDAFIALNGAFYDKI
jgi:hypothetical protein